MRGMGLTLSHTSALRALRRIRANDVDINTLETTSFTDAKPLVGKRWSEREFLHESWHWQVPRTKDPLHVLSTSRDERILYTAIRRHLVLRTLPLGSLLYLDERASIVCPELLFIQMAEMLTLPQLVALGNELCGNFCCDEMDPCNGEATLKIPHATTVEKLVIYLNSIKGIRGLVRAREALRYVCDNALSIPEAVLAAVYSLPPRESGYGMASLTLNDRYVVDEDAWTEERKTRVPDIMLPFAPIGINYDGEGHLDLDAIVRANETVHMVDPKDVEQARAELDACCRRVRSKYVDDIRRKRAVGRRKSGATSHEGGPLRKRAARCVHQTTFASVTRALWGRGSRFYGNAGRYGTCTGPLGRSFVAFDERLGCGTKLAYEITAISFEVLSKTAGFEDG